MTAAQLQAGAVAAAQIRAGSIGAAKIQSGSLTGAQIQPGSLTGTQVLGSTLSGVSAAAIGTVQYVASSASLEPASPTGTAATAGCPGGTRVIGGGATVSNPESAFVNESAPAAGRNGWTATGFGPATATITVTAICTPVTTASG